MESKIKKPDDTSGPEHVHGAAGTLHRWQECRMLQPQGKTAGSFFLSELPSYSMMQRLYS